MTILLALAVFGLMMTVCIHFMLVEDKRLEKRETNATAFWQPAYITKRATSANRQA